MKDLLNRLIDQYKKFSRIETSTLELDLGSFDDISLHVVDGSKSVMDKFNNISS